MKYLDAIEARVKAATPGRVTITREAFESEVASLWIDGKNVPVSRWSHARTDIEALLRVVRAATRVYSQEYGHGPEQTGRVMRELGETLAALDAEEQTSLLTEERWTT